MAVGDRSSLAEAAECFKTCFYFGGGCVQILYRLSWQLSILQQVNVVRPVTWVTLLTLCQQLEFFVAGRTALVGLAEFKLQSGRV